MLSLRRSIIDRVIQMNVHPIDIRPLLSLNVKLQIDKKHNLIISGQISHFALSKSHSVVLQCQLNQIIYQYLIIAFVRIATSPINYDEAISSINTRITTIIIDVLMHARKV